MCFQELACPLTAISRFGLDEVHPSCWPSALFKLSEPAVFTEIRSPIHVTLPRVTLSQVVSDVGKLSLGRLWVRDLASKALSLPADLVLALPWPAAARARR